MERRLTLKEGAENLRWGPIISEPRSLGMVYAYKMLLWMQAQRQAGRVPV